MADEEVEAEFEQPPPPPPVPRRRSSSALGAAMLALGDIIYGHKRNEIVMVADADGMPEPDFDVQLTPDPKDSVVILRNRWRHRS